MMGIEHKTILFITCTLNDTDGEIREYASALKDKKEKKGHKVVLIDFETSENIPPNIKFDEVCFISHHRFFDPEKRALPLSERTIGGYSIRRIRENVFQHVFSRKICSIKFYGCETAVDATTLNNDHNGISKIVLPVSELSSDSLDSLPFEENNQLSTVGYIALEVKKELERKKDFREVKIQGINGVGYIKKHNPMVRSFHHDALPLLNKIIQEESQLRSISNKTQLRKQKEKIADLEHKFEREHVFGKRSAHNIQYKVQIESWA